MATQAKTTIDHDTIREWVEERGGQPSVVRLSGESGKGGGILRINFGDKEESLEEVSWDEFFRIFDDRELAFLYEDDAEGKEGYFCKFVSRSEGDSDEFNDLDEEV